MSSILSKITDFASKMDVGADAPPLMPVQEPLQFAEKRRGRASLGAMSSPGIVSYSGFLHYPNEKDRAWSDQQARDDTILEMSNNPVIGGVLRQISMFIRQVEWTLEAADDSAEALEIRDFYAEQLDHMKNLWPGETLPQILSFLVWGWCALELIYKPLPDGRIGWAEWRLIPQETRWGWKFDGQGNATHLIQIDPQTYKELEVPLWKCLHVRDTSRNNSPEGFTLLRIAYDAYFYRSGFQQLEGTLFERYGGVQVARLPADDIEANTEAYQELKRIVTTLGINAQTGLVLSSDRDPSTNERYQDFEIIAPAAGATVPSANDIINRYANEIVGVFGAAVTRTGQDGSGSYALADVQNEVFQRNMEAYLDLIGDCIQTQAFPRLAELPYNNFPHELLPILKHGKLDKIKLNDLGAYLVSLAQAGVIHDSGSLRKYAHEQAALPTPPVEVIDAELERQKEADEEARQQKINPLGTQQDSAVDNPGPEKLDPQDEGQDKVPEVTAS